MGVLCFYVMVGQSDTHLWLVVCCAQPVCQLIVDLCSPSVMSFVRTNMGVFVMIFKTINAFSCFWDELSKNCLNRKLVYYLGRLNNTRQWIPPFWNVIKLQSFPHSSPSMSKGGLEFRNFDLIILKNRYEHIQEVAKMSKLWSWIEQRPSLYSVSHINLTVWEEKEVGSDEGCVWSLGLSSRLSSLPVCKNSSKNSECPYWQILVRTSNLSARTHKSIALSWCRPWYCRLICLFQKKIIVIK